VVDLVTRLIWAALSGTLGDAGITVDPDQPLPSARQPDEAPPATAPRDPGGWRGQLMDTEG
jgi:hypothetical protein